MSTRPEFPDPDSAAVFAAAMSLWRTCERHHDDEDSIKFSECYNGMDQFMREVMRVANHFEAWSCTHINFDEMEDVWPYLLQDNFGEACLAVIAPGALSTFDDKDCLRVALQMRLPVKLADSLPIPIDVVAQNPVHAAGFQAFRIQTVRDSIADEDIAPFTVGHDPFDENFGAPYFGVYGVGDDGLLEHIADRRTYADAVSLVRKLAPGIDAPTTPTS